MHTRRASHPLITDEFSALPFPAKDLDGVGTVPGNQLSLLI